MPRIKTERTKGLKYGLGFGIPFSLLFIYLFAGGSSIYDAIMGVLIAVLVAAFLLLYFELIAPLLRRAPFLASVIGAGLGIAASVALALLVGIWLSQALRQRISPLEPALLSEVLRIPTAKGFQMALAITTVGIIVLNFFLELSRKLGPGVMRDWFLGRYRRPRVEERVFMFIDLRDSTTLAENMGPLIFSDFVRDFFEDLTYPLVKSKGSVSHYIGDEAVISWPMELGLKNANCLVCFFLFEEEIASREPYYTRRYGVVPTFKAGAHCGEAVVTEVGRIKSEIVYHGDVLNTTARLTALCSDLGESLLISRDLADSLQAHPYVTESRGGQFLKGKRDEVEVLAVRPQRGDARVTAQPVPVD